eukprot:TRINITY_DN22645_c0_g1_i1.p1 TRINITY_DN22645_c0_g1~~TRINITY_DN22645_c0_g1_i1.p1  ORF type:complete len:607 (+),score=208.98 TRINITY_DN22645_c0_g1_i1:107-1927(+)
MAVHVVLRGADTRALSPRRRVQQRGWSLLGEERAEHVEQTLVSKVLPPGPPPAGMNPFELVKAVEDAVPPPDVEGWAAMTGERRDQLLAEELKRSQKERGVAQENDELKAWVRKAAQVIDKSALKQEQQQGKIERLEASNQHLEAAHAAAAAERDALRAEMNEMRTQHKFHHEQLCSFTLQLRRMKRQCEEFKSTLQLTGVSAAAVHAFEKIIRGQVPLTVEPLLPGGRAYKIEEGREAMTSLHGAMTELLEHVRAFVATHVLSQEKVAEVVHIVGEASPRRVAVSPPRPAPPESWETAAQSPEEDVPRAPVYTEQLVIKENLERTLAELNRPRVTPNRSPAMSPGMGPSPYVQERGGTDLLTDLAARLTEKENAALQQKVAALEARQGDVAAALIGPAERGGADSPRHPYPMPPLSQPPPQPSPRAAPLYPSPSAQMMAEGSPARAAPMPYAENGSVKHISPPRGSHGSPPRQYGTGAAEHFEYASPARRDLAGQDLWYGVLRQRASPQVAPSRSSAAPALQRVPSVTFNLPEHAAGASEQPTAPAQYTSIRAPPPGSEPQSLYAMARASTLLSQPPGPSPSRSNTTTSQLLQRAASLGWSEFAT